MNRHICLEHEFINFSIRGQDMFLGFGKEEEPAVSNGIHFFQGLREGFVCHCRRNGIRNSSDSTY